MPGDLAVLEPSKGDARRSSSAHAEGSDATPSTTAHVTVRKRVDEREWPDEPEGNGRFLKTRMCVFHQKGACVKGIACTYAHDDAEIRQAPDLVKTRLCQDWLNSRCTAEKCKFAHGRQELRFTKDYYKTKLCHFWQQGGCTKGELCRHAHGVDELRTMAAGEGNARPKNQKAAGPVETRNCRDVAADLLDLDDFQCIPSPSRGQLRKKKQPTSSGAVLQALRLAEEARLLMARSTELLESATGTREGWQSWDGGPLAKSPPATEQWHPRSSVSSTVAPSSNNYCVDECDNLEDLTKTVANLLVNDKDVLKGAGSHSEWIEANQGVPSDLLNNYMLGDNERFDSCLFALLTEEAK